MDKEAIEVAVNWWAEKLKSCKQSGLSAEERASGENRSYEVAEMLMQIGKPKVSEDQIEAFKANLRTALESRPIRCLDVDYGPDMNLGAALDAAGIPSGTGTLPIKTIMWIDDDKVAVRYGYGAPEEVLWPAASAKTAA